MSGWNVSSVVTGVIIGIRAEAEILIPSGDASIVQEITSGGLWGVESDSDEIVPCGH